jgi:hypothetical protein
LIIEDIVTQHAEEAAFLWLLRDIAVYAPHYSLADLSELDDRVEAHLDGLRIAGDAGWEICKGALEQKEVGEIFAASVLAFESRDETRIQTVLEVGSVEPELSQGIISALGWLSYQQAEIHINKLLTSDSSNLRRIGIAASAVQRQYPVKPLIDALSDNDLLLKARALQAVGQFGRVDLLSLLRLNLTAEDDLCRFNAAWSAALLGDTSAVSVLKTFVTPVRPPHPRIEYGAGSNPLPQGARERAEEAVKIALRRMDLESAHSWQKELAQNPETVRLALIGAGAIGDPILIPWLIEQMKTPVLARVAGEAFTMITGVDIAYEDLEGKWPEGFEAGPTENPEDENVEMDPDEDLPWPNPELILGWWNKNKGLFKNGTRYLLGKPITFEHLQQVLRIGFQRQRYAASIELAMMKPGQPLFEVCAPGFRQKQMLELK